MLERTRGIDSQIKKVINGSGFFKNIGKAIAKKAAPVALDYYSIYMYHIANILCILLVMIS
jgi:hypothetical protein